MTVTHVFWPVGGTGPGTSPSSGFLIGWQRGSLVCVASLVHASKTLEVEERLERCATLDEGSSLRVIGEFGSVKSPQRNKAIKAKWLRAVVSGNKVSLSEAPSPIPLLIFYSRPSMYHHHFFSLLNTLAPPDSEEIKKLEISGKLAANMRNLNDRCLDEEDEISPSCLTKIIDCINASHAVHKELQSNRAALPAIKGAVPASLQRPLPSRFGRLAPLVRWSVTVQQLVTRLAQLSTWPGKYAIIRKGSPSTLLSRRAQYVRLFNTMWMIANDVIVGYTLGVALRQNARPWSAWLLDKLRSYTVESLVSLLRWTNSYPVGLKLNDELGDVFCATSAWAVEAWYDHAILPLSPLLPHILYAIGVASTFGATFALATFADLISLITVHLYYLYRAFTLLFSTHLTLLGVLFNIFRGRKFNLLRGRNEPAVYGLDQLILGTILFTLAAFLLPTVLAFYLLLGVVSFYTVSSFRGRLFVVAIHAGIEAGLLLLNHFPLFAVMLRVKDPARLPAGIRLRPFDSSSLKLESVPVDLAWLFSDWIRLGRKLMSHYEPLGMLGKLVKGEAIKPLALRTGVEMQEG